MKIKSIGGIAGLWCSFLAAGTWLLPVSLFWSIGIGARSAEAALARHPVRNSDELLQKYQRGAVAAAWRAAWGSDAALGESVLTMRSVGEGDQVCDLVGFERAELQGSEFGPFLESMSVVDHAVWRESASCQIGRLDGTNASGLGDGVSIDVRISAGELKRGAEVGVPFVAAVLAWTSETNSSEGALLLPIAAPKSLAHATEVVTTMQTAQSQSDEGRGGGGLTCMNDQWMGNNGIQCCGLWAAYQARLGACLTSYAADILNCIRFALGGGCVTGLGLCLAIACRTMPPHVCLPLCGLACILVGLVALSLCMEEMLFRYNSCVQLERGEYFKQLTDSGCFPAPAGFGE
jgi:hypothetical protein